MTELEKYLDEKCIIPKIDYIDIINKFGYNIQDNKYNPIVINSPTGTGKTLRMLEFVSNPNTSGVIFVHSIDAGKNLINTLKTVFNYNSDDILEYHSKNQPIYDELTINPIRFNEWRWIICYATRLFSGNLKYYTSTTELSIEDQLNKMIHEATMITNHLSMSPYYKTGNKYVFIDECLSTPIKVKYTSADIAEFLTLIKYHKTSIFDLNKTDYEVIKHKFNGLFIEFKSKPESELNNLIEYRSIIRLLLRDKWTRRTYPIEVMKNIIGARGFNFIKNLFRNLDEAKRQMNIISDTVEAEWIAKIGVQDLPDTYPIIAFDATANINYKNSDFRIVNLEDLLNNYSEHTNLVEINILPYGYGSRELDKSTILKNWKSNLPRFKNDSIILWFKDAGKNDNVDTEQLVLDRCKELDITNYHFIYYGSGDIKGTNEFKSCKNIYILGQYFVNKLHVDEHKAATGSISYSVRDKCIADIIQLIGRSHIRLTRIKSKDQLTESDIVRIYFTNDNDKSIVEDVRSFIYGYYNLKDDYTKSWISNSNVISDEIIENIKQLDKSNLNLTDEVQLRDYIIKYIKSPSGKSLRQSTINNIIKLIINKSDLSWTSIQELTNINDGSVAIQLRNYVNQIVNN